MLLIAFLQNLAMVTIVLGFYALLKYAVPDSLPGRVATILT